MEEVHINLPPAKSTKDLLHEETMQRAISSYFKENPEVLYPHIAEPLRRKIEESSGEQLDGTLAHARDSLDVEKFTQSLITDLLKEALQFKNQSNSDEEAQKDKNKAKYLIYTAIAGFLTTGTGILATYFISNQ